MKMDGDENAYVLHRELGEWMTANVTVVRHNDKLLKTDDKIQELMERFKKININDTTKWSNQGAMFTRQFSNMLQLARVITLGAYNRNESRGAHYKPDFLKEMTMSGSKRRWLNMPVRLKLRNLNIRMSMYH